MLRDRYTCQVCHVRRRARQLDVDHIVEIARGGAALEFSNLQTICRGCHRAKTARFLRDRAVRRRRAGPESLADSSAERGWTAGWFPA